MSGVIEFRALVAANKERSAYGLRYNDFQRYREHCANRVHRLRSTLKMTHGKGRKFEKLPPITLDTVRSGHLQLLLFEAERAWAYAQELLMLSTKNGETQSRRAAMGRFRRAQKWTEQLLELCKSLHNDNRLTQDAFVQVNAYGLLLKGRIMRLRDEFDAALAHLSVGRTLLDQLSSSASTSHDQAVATVFIDEISPEIRHCAHSLGYERAYEIERIVKKEAPRHAENLVPGYGKLIADLQEEAKQSGGLVGKSQLGGLVWEGQPVPVRNPELVGALLKVESSSQKLASSQFPKASKPQRAGKSRNKIASFDGVLQALSDAEEVARKLSEAQKITGGAGTAATGTRDIHFVHSYITYQLLSRRTERDSLLIDALIHGEDQTTKTADSPSDPRIFPAVVKILDTVLQSLTQMRGLTIVDESPDVTSATEARIAFTKSQRCLYMARAYSTLKRYAEALSITQSAHIRLREARYQLSLLVTPSIPEATYFLLADEPQLTSLESDLNAEELKLKREWFAYNGGTVDGTEADALMKKPLFYDIAFNSVNLPMDRLLRRAGRVPAPMLTPAPVGQPTKAKIDEPAVLAVPEPEESAPALAHGGLSNLLGGWWGRR